MGRQLGRRHGSGCTRWPTVSIGNVVTCDCGAMKWYVGRRERVYRRLTQFPGGDYIRENLEILVRWAWHKILWRLGN